MVVEATMRRAAAVVGIAIAAAGLGCGKRPAPPPPPPASDAEAADARPSTPPASSFLPPLGDDAKPVENGRYAGAFRAMVATMHSREHTSHARTSLHATLQLTDERAGLCIETERTWRSSRSPYIQPPLPDGGRAPWKDTSSSSHASRGFRGTVTRYGSSIEIALQAQPSACPDAGSGGPSLVRQDATLRCASVKRVDDGDDPRILLACQWVEGAPYDGPGLVLPTTQERDGGAHAPNASDSARGTWILFALASSIEVLSSEDWSSPRSSLQLR
jgi:hypothetical protein